jgi:hypothetical protein
MKLTATQYLLDNFTVHVSQSIVPSLKLEGEFRVVDAKAMKYGGV